MSGVPPRPLPPDAAELLDRFGAPPRLVAHSALVHHVAITLVDAFGEQFPELAVDREALLFGAATHDIGKVRPPRS